MRNSEGEEILDPGDYDLGEGQTLRIYLTQDEDEQLHMWACTHCQEVDGVLNAILVNVVDGRMSLRQEWGGGFSVAMTEAGVDAVKAMIEEWGQSGE